MLKFYPFASGSEYTASYAISSSHALNATTLTYTVSASVAETVTNPVSGSRGKSICLLTYQQYLLMVNSGSREICDFSD